MAQIEISPDGREIWEWASQLIRRISLTQKRRDLHDQIANVQNRCGSCAKWMIPQCPREKHDNRKGRRVGPHTNSFSCQQFEMDWKTEDLIKQWTNEIASIDEKLK